VSSGGFGVSMPCITAQGIWQEASSPNFGWQPMQHSLWHWQCSLHHKSVLFALNCSWTDKPAWHSWITTRNSGRDHTTTHLEAAVAQPAWCTAATHTATLSSSVHIAFNGPCSLYATQSGVSQLSLDRPHHTGHAASY